LSIRPPNGELAIHNPALERIKKKHSEVRLSNSDNWEKHVPYLGNWVAGNTERNTYENVDTYEWIEDNVETLPKGQRGVYIKEIIEEIDKLLKKDFSWFKKFGPDGDLIKERAVRFKAAIEKLPVS
jgi:hypothetical protein